MSLVARSSQRPLPRASPSTETIYNGNPVTYPEYYPTLAGNKEIKTSDLGLIILDKPVKKVTEFPALPTDGFTETLPTKTDLTVIGYGLQEQVTPKNNGPANSWIGTVSRNSATVQLLNSNFQGSDYYLELTANSAQDKGTVVFGDSGGPVIYTQNGAQDIVLAVNAFVLSDNCNGVSYHTRLDTAEILAWISGYLN
jgi:secreted trypsin-like serine protease